MDISALKKDRFQAWVPFDDEVKILIRFVPRDELVAIGKKAVVVTLDPKTKKESRDYDVIAADVMIAKAAVVDWDGLTLDGEPFPCTAENIELLVSKWGEFSKFISNACVDVGLLAVKQQEQAEKN